MGGYFFFEKESPIVFRRVIVSCSIAAFSVTLLSGCGVIRYELVQESSEPSELVTSLCSQIDFQLGLEQQWGMDFPGDPALLDGDILDNYLEWSLDAEKELSTEGDAAEQAAISDIVDNFIDLNLEYLKVGSVSHEKAVVYFRSSEASCVAMGWLN